MRRTLAAAFAAAGLAACFALPAQAADEVPTSDSVAAAEDFRDATTAGAPAPTSYRPLAGYDDQRRTVASASPAISAE